MHPSSRGGSRPGTVNPQIAASLQLGNQQRLEQEAAAAYQLQQQQQQRRRPASSTGSAKSYEDLYPILEGGSRSVAVQRVPTAGLVIDQQGSSGPGIAIANNQHKQQTTTTTTPQFSHSTYPMRRPQQVQQHPTSSHKGLSSASRNPTKILSPAEAIQRAEEAKYAVLDYSLAAIVPGQPSSLQQQQPQASLNAQQQASLRSKMQATSTTVSTSLNRNSPLRHRSPGRGVGTPPLAMLQLPPQREVDRETGTCTYTQFQLSMERMHQRLGHLPLQQRWREVAEWIDLYYYGANVTNLVDTIEVLYTEMDAKESQQAKELKARHDQRIAEERMRIAAMSVGSQVQHPGGLNDSADRKKFPPAPKPLSPNGLRTAVAFMLLEQMVNLTTTAFPQLSEMGIRVVHDIQKSVYATGQTPVDLTGTFFVLENPKDLAEQQQLINRFYGKTYFQCLRELSSKTQQTAMKYEESERMRDKQSRILNRVVDYWTTYTLNRLFRAWRGYIRNKKFRVQLSQKIQKLQQELTDTQKSTHLQSQEHQKISALEAERCRVLESDVELLRGQLMESKKVNRELSEDYQQLHQKYQSGNELKMLRAEVRRLQRDVGAERQKVRELQQLLHEHAGHEIDLDAGLGDEQLSTLMDEGFTEDDLFVQIRQELDESKKICKGLQRENAELRLALVNRGEAGKEE